MHYQHSLVIITHKKTSVLCSIDGRLEVIKNFARYILNFYWVGGKELFNDFLFFSSIFIHSNARLQYMKEE